MRGDGGEGEVGKEEEGGEPRGEGEIGGEGEERCREGERGG